MDKKYLEDKNHIEEELAHKICGYVTRKGTLCKNTPEAEHKFCPMHQAIDIEKSSYAEEEPILLMEENNIDEVNNIAGLVIKNETNKGYSLEEVFGGHAERQSKKDDAPEKEKNEVENERFEDRLLEGMELNEDEPIELKEEEYVSEAAEEKGLEREEKVTEEEVDVTDFELLLEEPKEEENKEEIAEEIELEIDKEVAEEELDVTDFELLLEEPKEEADKEEIAEDIELEIDEEARKTENEDDTDILSLIDELNEAKDTAAREEENEVSMLLEDFDELENKIEEEDLKENTEESLIEEIELDAEEFFDSLEEELTEKVEGEEEPEEIDVSSVQTEEIDKIDDELNLDMQDIEVEKDEEALTGLTDENDLSMLLGGLEKEAVEEEKKEEEEELFEEQLNDVTDFDNTDGHDEVVELIGKSSESEILEEEKIEEGLVENDLDDLFAEEKTLEGDMEEMSNEKNKNSIPILMEEDDNLFGDDDLEALLSGVDENTDTSALISGKKQLEDDIDDFKMEEEIDLEDEPLESSKELVDGFKSTDENEEEEKSEKKKENKKSGKVKKDKKKSNFDFKYFVLKNKYKIILAAGVLILVVSVFLGMSILGKNAKKTTVTILNNVKQKKNAGTMEKNKETAAEKKTEAPEHEHKNSEEVKKEETHLTEKTDVEKVKPIAEINKEEKNSNAEQLDSALGKVVAKKEEYIASLDKKMGELKNIKSEEEQKSADKNITEIKETIANLDIEASRLRGEIITGRIEKVMISCTPDRNVFKMNGAQVVIGLKLKEDNMLKSELEKEKVYRDLVYAIKTVFQNEKDINTVNINVFKKEKPVSKKMEITARRYEFEKIEQTKYTNKQIISLFDFYEKK